MDKLMKTICDELEKISERGLKSAGDLDMAYKLIMSKEKLLRIGEIEAKTGYSQANSYGRGYNSYMDGYGRDGMYSQRGNWEASGMYDRDNRYSREDGYAMMGSRMAEIMNDPGLSQAERNALKRAMDSIR